MKSFKKLLPFFLIITLLSLKGWFAGKIIYWAYLFSLSFLFAFLLTPAARWIALKRKIIDYPDKRKIHKSPIPRLGGGAVYLSFVLVILYNFHFSLQLKGVVLATSLIFALGLFDDIKELPAALKLGVQIFAVLLLIHYGVVLSFPYPGFWWGKILASLLTILWIVGITNAINFLDGLDGLVTGLGIIASLFFLVIALESGQIYLAYLSIVLAGTLAGFLGYNSHPAKIFLGDSGSTFIGFFLAAIAVMGGWAENNPLVALGTTILILSIPIFDMIYITISRIGVKRITNFSQWLSYVGKDHLHHRLLNLGFSQKEAVLLIYFLAFSLGIGSLILRSINQAEIFLILTQVGFIFLVIVILMNVAKKGKA